MTALGERMESYGEWFTRQDFRSPAVSVGRSLLALSTVLTLLTNRPDMFFRPRALENAWNFFHFFYGVNPYLANGAGALAMLIVISGWRPRVTAFLHAWVANSVLNGALFVEGGDGVHAILSLFLIPLLLSDGRKNHWSFESLRPLNPWTSILSTSGWILIRLQVAAIYLHAGAGKAPGADWKSGTAIYFWATHPFIGLGDVTGTFLAHIFHSSVLVFILTWGTMILEMLLFAALLAEPRIQRVFLGFGILFHLGIYYIHGLFSFCMVMMAALVLYLGPTRRNILQERNA